MLNLSGEASPKKGRILALSQGCSVQKDHAEAFILQTSDPVCSNALQVKVSLQP